MTDREHRAVDPRDYEEQEPLAEIVGNLEERVKLASRTPEGFLAFGFGSGLLSRAPGTMGTLAAIPIAIPLAYLELIGFWFLALSFVLGIWVCNQVTRALGVEDYGGIVWDEMVGFWMVVAFVPLHWAWYLAAFLLFRVFDILKPWPISLLEEYFTGGLGVMLDDALAALYSILILAFVKMMIPGG